jgi:hypothetical protein
MDMLTDPTGTIITDERRVLKRRLAAAALLCAVIAGGAWLLYQRQLPPPPPAPIVREIRVTVPRDSRVELELNGDLFFNDPQNEHSDGDGVERIQEYHGLKPGNYRVHAKGPVTPTSRSFWVDVTDARSSGRQQRGVLPAKTGYGTLDVTVE